MSSHQSRRLKRNWKRWRKELGRRLSILTNPIKTLRARAKRRATAAQKRSKGFINAYLRTRPWKLLLAGIPALLLCFPFAVAMGMIAFQRDSVRVERYRKAFRLAAEKSDFAAAQLCEQKLVQLGVDDSSVRFTSAVALDEKEKNPRAAFEKMSELASPDTPGYFPAHVWIAQAILSDRLPFLSPSDANRIVVGHLDQAIKLRPSITTLKLLKAQWYLRLGQSDDARALLAEVVPILPAEQVMVAGLSVLLGDRESGHRIAVKADQEYERMANQPSERDAPLTAADYLRWSVVRQIVKDATAAREVIGAGRKKFPSDKALQDIEAELVTMAAKASQGDASERMALLTEVMSSNNESPIILSMLAELAVENTPGGQLARLRLESLFQEGKLPLEPALLWGERLALRSEFAKSRDWYERLIVQFSDNAVAHNNLAWLLAFKEPVDLDRALKLVQRALDLAPKNAGFLDTRGQIYVKLKRWTEARDDLQFAINGLPASRETHLALAEAYEALGDAEKAAAHRNARP